MWISFFIQGGSPLLVLSTFFLIMVKLLNIFFKISYNTKTYPIVCRRGKVELEVVVGVMVFDISWKVKKVVASDVA